MALAPARLLLQFVVAAVYCAPLGVGLDNGLAQVPIRGYQSWNDLGAQVSCDFDLRNFELQCGA